MDKTPIARITYKPEEAAAALGVSRDFFDEHVKPEIRVIRRGRLVLIPARELERWADENATSVLEAKSTCGGPLARKVAA